MSNLLNYLHDGSSTTDAAAAAARLLHAHYLRCAATVHRLHSRPAPALPTANSPTCLTLYYYLYDCGSTISLLAADAATAAARALPNLRYHRLLSRQAPTPALPTQLLLTDLGSAPSPLAPTPHALHAITLP